MSFGIFAALTLLDGGIELAAGYHAINNLFLGLIANYDVSPLATPSIFVTNLSEAPLLATYFVDLFGLLVILNMKYRWFAYRGPSRRIGLDLLPTGPVMHLADRYAGSSG